MKNYARPQDHRAEYLKLAREEAAARRQAEKDLITLECPLCFKTVGVPEGTPGRCLGCKRNMEVQR